VSKVSEAAAVINAQQYDFEPANVYSRNGKYGFYKHSWHNEHILGKWFVWFCGNAHYFDTEQECRDYILDGFDKLDLKTQNEFNTILDNELKDI